MPSWLHSAHWWIFSRILSDRWSLRAWSPLSATSYRRTCSIRIWLIRRQNSASRSRRRLPKRCSTVLRFQPWCRSLTFVTYMPKRKSLTSVWMWVDTQAPRRNTMKKYYQSFSGSTRRWKCRDSRAIRNSRRKLPRLSTTWSTPWTTFIRLRRAFLNSQPCLRIWLILGWSIE